MGKASVDKMCLNSSSIENKEIVFLQEALSLSDLPNNEEKQTTRESPRGSVTQEDFAFCSFDGSLLNILEMCTADEVFFQGQILPLSHSIGMPTDSHNNGFRGEAMCNQRSTTESSPNYALQMRTESMEHCHPSVGITKSSVKSTITNTTTSSSYKPRIRNQFYSHQSPTPQVRFSKVKHRNINSSNRKSNMWSLFRVGLVTISPEIALQDLKNRCNKDFGSQSSTSSSSSSSSSNSSSNNENKMRIIQGNKNKKRYLEKNRTFLRSCKCSVKAVEIADSNVITMNRHDDLEGNKDAPEMKETEKKQGTARKQIMSGYHTFDEWLKQLSLESPADEA